MRIPVGERFGKFTVLSIGTKNSWAQRVIARCDCGTIKQVALPSLRSKGKSKTLSCGCHRRRLLLHTTHGHKTSGKESKTYKSWRSMLARCDDESNIGYPRYGGRGIGYPPEWKDFSSFLSDMGERPVGTTLDRIDGSRGYSRENCRWANAKVQARNQSNNRYFTRNGETKCLAEWAELSGLPYTAVQQRIGKGWDIERALTAPLRVRQRKPIQRLVEAAGLVRVKRLQPDDGC